MGSRLFLRPYPAGVAEATSGWDIAGTIADSVSGFGTLGAFALAIYLYWRQGEDARRDQASKVFVTLDDDNSSLVIDNSSPFPIFQVLLKVDSRFITDEARVWEYASRMSPQAVGEVVPIPADIVAPDLAVMAFKDAAGHRWKRDSHGKLSSDNGELQRIIDAAAAAEEESMREARRSFMRSRRARRQRQADD